MRLIVSSIVLGLVAFGVFGTASAQESSGTATDRPIVVAQAGGQNPGGQNPDDRTGGGNATMVPTSAPAGGGTQVGSQTEGQSGGGGPSGTGPASGDEPTTNVRGSGPAWGDLPWLLLPLALLAVLGAFLLASRRGSAERTTVGSGRRE